MDTPQQATHDIITPVRALKLRRILWMRWISNAAGAVLLLGAYFGFGLRFPIWWAFGAMAASVLINLFMMVSSDEDTHNAPRKAMAILVIDALTMALVLMLVGGLTNPFALILLSGTVLGAVTLETRQVYVLAAIAAAAFTAMEQVYVPIGLPNGTDFHPAWGMVAARWVALMIALIFCATVIQQIARESSEMAEAMNAMQISLAREQKLTEIGSIVASTAHELGTPLATMTLVSTELIDELADRPDLQDDAKLLRQQADRCRDILRSMGRAGKEDQHLRATPLSALLAEAAEPHLNRGITISIQSLKESLTLGDENEPYVTRRPEVLHGLRNLIQNAVDFADSRVLIHLDWSAAEVRVRIADDGPGYPAHVLSRIGDPFLRGRQSVPSGKAAEGYEGMGLGLFIARTLLRRSGATLTFANASDTLMAGPNEKGLGAVVRVAWARDTIAPEGLSRDRPLGVNPTRGL